MKEAARPAGPHRRPTTTAVGRPVVISGRRPRPLPPRYRSTGDHRPPYRWPLIALPAANYSALPEKLLLPACCFSQTARRPTVRPVVSIRRGSAAIDRLSFRRSTSSLSEGSRIILKMSCRSHRHPTVASSILVDGPFCRRFFRLTLRKYVVCLL